jgi:selenium metabolism protein YedF
MVIHGWSGHKRTKLFLIKYEGESMTKTVDARGLACPQPVILTRKAMVDSSDVTVLVASAISRDNVQRMAERAGRQVTITEVDGEFHLRIVDQNGGLVSSVGASPEEQSHAGADGRRDGPLVLVVSDNKMGRGDEELGEILVRAFFHTLGEVEPNPDTIILFNAGVRLAVEGSPVLEDLQALATSGIRIMSCGTSLKYFDLSDRVGVGVVSNMYDIAACMLAAGKSVTL